MGPHPYWAMSSPTPGEACGLSVLMSFSSPSVACAGGACSDVVGLGGAHARRLRLLSPLPARDLGHVITVAGDVLLVSHELVAHGLLGIGGPRPELGDAVDHVLHQVEPVEIVQDAHVEGRGRGALFLVATHVHV